MASCRRAAAIVSGLLVAVLLAALGAGLIRDVRERGEVTMHTLAGMLDLPAAGDVLRLPLRHDRRDRAGSAVRRHRLSSQPERLFFSFVTLCTVGYGDIVPAGDLTRAISVAEMLIGQFYLVTVVALIVSNLGRRRAA